MELRALRTASPERVAVCNAAVMLIESGIKAGKPDGWIRWNISYRATDINHIPKSVWNNSAPKWTIWVL